MLAIPGLLVFGLKMEETTARQKSEPGEFATLLNTKSCLVFPFESRRNVVSGYKTGIISPGIYLMQTVAISRKHP